MEKLAFGSFKFYVHHISGCNILTDEFGIDIGTFENVQERISLLNQYLISEKEKAQERIIRLEKALTAVECYYAD